MGGLFELVGKGVGVVVEYRQHCNQQKSLQECDEASSRFQVEDGRRCQRRQALRGITPPHVANEYESGLESTNHCEDIPPHNPPSYEESEERNANSDKLAQEVVNINRRRPAAQRPLTRRPLPCPVILPQRRPGSKSRGFVRAYAPVLENAGIDQDTFLAFLKNFHRSSKASPVFGIVQISAGIAGFAPSAIATVVSMAVGAAAKVGEEMHTRMRTNDFLNKMNNELFIPAQLYAMIVQYKSDADANHSLGYIGLSSSTAELNTTSTIATRTLDSSSSSGFFQRQNFRVAAGTTNGLIAMPQAAPLIYPEVNNSVAGDRPETFKGKAKDFKKFLNGYNDRKAQMKYARDNPGSALVLPEEQRAFKSKFSDPNHPMYNGGLVGFISGGQLTRDRLHDMKDGGASRRDDGQVRRGTEMYESTRGRGSERSGSRRNNSSSSSRDSRDLDDQSGRDSRDSRREGGTVRRALKEGVLYLMIVNMPSDAELTQARRELERIGRS